jgi:uncharacterized protein YbbC (DUF1343 family)
MSIVHTGLQELLDNPQLVGDRRWALLANHAAVTGGLDPARMALTARLAGPLVCLYGPEHGLEGVVQDMEAVDNAIDPLTGAEVRSLYGDGVQSLAPQPDDLDGVEVLLVDLPDIGTRYYTFAATMDAVMAAAEAAGVEVMVLDRPNPIGGVAREGGAIRPGNESFVSQIPTPVRHGLSLGEIALLLQRERYPDIALEIVMCRGWQRSQWWDETGLPWVPPSPNMPVLETAGIYPGLCLIEATELSEGRGTTRPFHLVGAPWVDGRRLVATMRRHGLPGVGFRTAVFRPMFGKWVGEVCNGVEIHLTDREAIRPLAVGMILVKELHDSNPECFEWRRDPYEFITDPPALDLLTGSDLARRAIEAGEPLEPLLEQWKVEVAEFNSTLEGILLYHDE